MKKAFTMAEILLSLTIIGVVAAITLPSLTGNINERTWNTQRKALYSRMSQAISLMPALNGYGNYQPATGSVGTDSYTPGIDNAAETFITEGLSKVLKINNICDAEHFEDCGIASKIIRIDGNIAFTSFPNEMSGFNSNLYQYYANKISMPKMAAFETQNGESIVVFYNPTCISENNVPTWTNNSGGQGQEVAPFLCANFVYDLNGSKGPNTVGKDIGFMSAMYATDTKVVAPMPLPKMLANSSGHADYYVASKMCTENNSRIPNIEELSAMYYNQDLLNMTSTYCSSTMIDANQLWELELTYGQRRTHSKTCWQTRCIKR